MRFCQKKQIYQIWKPYPLIQTQDIQNHRIKFRHYVGQAFYHPNRFDLQNIYTKKDCWFRSKFILKVFFHSPLPWKPDFYLNILCTSLSPAGKFKELSAVVPMLYWIICKCDRQTDDRQEIPCLLLLMQATQTMNTISWEAVKGLILSHT